jgi:multicomponent Na+:H+ antiporter subunit E
MVVDVCVRLALLFGLWALLNPADYSSWGIGIFVVGVAVIVSFVLRPRLSWIFPVAGLVKFTLYFLKHSLHGGIDVSRRALAPSMPLQPGFVDVTLRLPAGMPRLVLVCVVSLLPGTLSARWKKDWLRVHALDVRLPVLNDIRALETIIGGIFEIKL